MNIWKSKKVTVQVEGSVNAVLPATYEIVPPMVAPTTFPASNVTLGDVGSRFTATEVETALQEIAGSGRTTETVKGNTDAVTALQTATYKKIDAAGDLLYGSAADTLARLPIGATGKVLTVVAGLPSWSDVQPMSEWIPITAFSNSWVDNGGSYPAKYRKNGLGVVEFRGMIKDGISSLAITMPDGYRAAFYLQRPTISNGALATLYTDASGEIHVLSGSNVGVILDGFSYSTT